jgi:predicted TIM-barrel fold metal-dependent hydrolase
MRSRLLKLTGFTILTLLMTSKLQSAQDFILDSHIHSGENQQWVDDLVKTYQARNAMACVLTPMGNFELIAKAAQEHPEVVVPYGQVRPDDPNALREIETFYRAGFVGIKFHSPEEDWDSPKYWQLYRSCEQFGLLMLFHTGISNRPITSKPNLGSSMRMRPGFLETIARLCPRAVIQGAHFGNPWYDEAAEVCRWSPNVFFDITGSTLHKLIKLNELERFLKILWWTADEGEQTMHTLKGGPDAFEHIVFGTDEDPAGLAGNIERFQKFLTANKVPESLRPKMWGLTMARILNIDPSTRKFRHQRPIVPGTRPLFDPENFGK